MYNTYSQKIRNISAISILAAGSLLSTFITDLQKVYVLIHINVDHDIIKNMFKGTWVSNSCQSLEHANASSIKGLKEALYKQN